MTDDRPEQDEEMNCGLTMPERDCLRSRLSELAEIMPPRAVWQRIERQARAEGLIRRPGMAEGLRWAVGAGIAATVVFAVLNLPSGQRGDGALTTTADTDLPTVPDYDERAEDARLQSINALMVQSQLLERDLRRLPYQPQVMRASTTATIDDLQSRIAAIDYRLNQPGVRMTREEQEAFWRERVRLMDSLVRLRYAQAQRVSF